MQSLLCHYLIQTLGLPGLCGALRVEKTLCFLIRCITIVELTKCLNTLRISFQNDTRLLNNTWPEFTDCFVQTVPNWVPYAFLLLIFPLYLFSIKKNVLQGPFRVQRMNICRLASTYIYFWKKENKEILKLEVIIDCPFRVAYLGYMKHFFIQWILLTC